MFFYPKRGFTMLEITIVLAISLICFLVILGMYVSQSKLYTSESNISELQTINSIAQEIFTNTIGQGMEIVESRTINGSPYISDSDTVLIKLPAVDVSSQIINGVYDYIAFDFDQANSKIITDTEIGIGSARIAGQKTIANFVSALNFRYNNNVWADVDTIELTLAVKKDIGGEDREEKTFKTIQLKNK